MKKLTIVTVREFPNEADWQEYKQVSPLQTDWAKLERNEPIVIDQHHKGEIVKTTINLYEELPFN